jgi:release factor glutamine methyltransferase
VRDPHQPLSIVLREAARQILDSGCADDLDEALLEAELLYGAAARLDRTHVIAAGAHAAEPGALVRFDLLLARRVEHEPLAYILGERECYGLVFDVGPGVAIPRPETETLIDAVLAAVREHPQARRRVRVVDVGTGSGVVALAVARHALMANVYATDISAAALGFAERNRRRLGLADRVLLYKGNLLGPLWERVDVVAANLPYIATDVLLSLAPEIRVWEPRIAFDGGADGLDVLRALIEQLPARLASGPRAVLLEVGAGQAPAVAQLLEPAVGGAARLHHDLAGIERVVEVRSGY